MKTSLKLVVFIGIYFLTSCAVQKGYLRFQGKPDEIIATSQIKDYLKKHQNPTIVLKAPNSEIKSTQSDPLNPYSPDLQSKKITNCWF